MQDQQFTVIYPPNRPMEGVVVQPYNPITEGYLYFVDFNQKGELILGTSDVCGTGWYGSVLHYKNYERATTCDYSSYYVTDGTAGDAVFYDNNRLLVTDDSKMLKLLQLPEHKETVMTVQDTFETEDIIEGLTIWKGDAKIAICFDTSVLTLEMDNNSSLKHVNTFSNYHTETITSVDADQQQPNTFVTTSLDRKLCLWDDRASNCVSVLYQNEFSAMTAAACHPVLPSVVAAGNAAGDVYVIDKREPKQFVTVYNCFDSGVHRMRFEDSGKLAVCGDTKDVVVLNCTENSLKPLYISQEHKEVVRGLAWYEGGLYSCGYDGKCLRHLI